MKEIINFQLEVFDLSKINPLVSRYKLYIAYASEPANNYIFSEDVLNSMSQTIKGCPVVAGFMNKKDGSLLGGHESDLALNKDNTISRTPTPIPVGFAAYDLDCWWEEYKGRKYLTTFIYIWDGRFPELSNLSERSIFQSMEVAIDETQEGKFKKVTEAYALGLCLLENVEPAFKNSTIQKFSTFDEIDINPLKKEYESFSKQLENEEGDKVIKEAIEKFSLNSEQIREILRNGLSEHKYKSGDYEYCKYYVDSYDAEFVYVYDCEDGKTYSLKYSINDLIATIDAETKIEVIHGGFIPVGQKTEETMAKEDCENKEDMSSNEYVDNEAMNNLNDKSAEDNKELVNENKDEVIASLKTELSTTQEKMSQVEKDNSNLIEENSKLKEFKASIEKQNRDFEVESTLSEVSNSLPKDEIEAFKLSAENFTLENIDVWKNEVKAKAYNFSKGIPEKKSFIKVGLPVSDKPKRSSRLWDD